MRAGSVNLPIENFSKVLVLGSSGQLASSFRALTKLDARFKFFPKESLTRWPDAENAIADYAPDFIINCCAYTAVEKAEVEPNFCFELNENFVSRLAQLSTKLDCRLIHFSTDYVFDGKSTCPYSEDSPAKPINNYGRSKLAGEDRIHEFARTATILRTSWLYSIYGSNFLKTMLKLSQSRASISVVDDQRGTPTRAHDVADFVLNYLLTRQQGVEVFHYAGSGACSWYEFACEIMKSWNQLTVIEPCSTQPKSPKRPAYSVLSTQKLRQQFKVDIPDWRTSLAEFAKAYQEMGFLT